MLCIILQNWWPYNVELLVLLVEMEWTAKGFVMLATSSLIKWLANFISTEFSKRTYPTYFSIILLSVLISPSFFPEHFVCIFSNDIICSIVESRCLTVNCVALTGFACCRRDSKEDYHYHSTARETCLQRGPALPRFSYPRFLGWCTNTCCIWHASHLSFLNSSVVFSPVLDQLPFT